MPAAVGGGRAGRCAGQVKGRGPNEVRIKQVRQREPAEPEARATEERPAVDPGLEFGGGKGVQHRSLATRDAGQVATPSPGTPGEGGGEGLNVRMKDEGGRIKRCSARFILHPSQFILPR